MSLSRAVSHYVRTIPCYHSLVKTGTLGIVPSSTTSTPSTKRLLLKYSDIKSITSFYRIICSDSTINDKPKPSAVSEEPSPKTESSTKATDTPSDVTVVPKAKKGRTKLDVSVETTERNFLTIIRAMNEYLLKPQDIQDLRKFQRRSPYESEPPINVYLRADVEARAIQVWGTWDNLQKELRKRQLLEDSYKESVLNVKKILKEYKRQTDPEAKLREAILRTSGRVVVSAILINTANFFFKALACAFTGSHSLFAEAIHSMSDTLNQAILYIGIRKSIQRPNELHPYGYHSARYIASLISGVGIFCVGSGLSIYHGVNGLLNPEAMEPLYWAYLILGGSILSEGGTLLIAFNAIKTGARKSGLSFREYVTSAKDPTVNVVLLEDAAAVIGVLIAGTCMGLTSYYNTPFYDAVGSLLIGGLLGVVASFIVYSNSAALVGRSINQEILADVNRKLESDVMIRAIHDVKATDLGNDIVRYKAEVDIDGRQLSRHYLDTIDLESLLEEMKNIKTIEEVESLMLKHGENIVDLIGAEIDRIEKELKKKHPQLRHVDLEVL